MARKKRPKNSNKKINTNQEKNNKKQVDTTICDSSKELKEETYSVSTSQDNNTNSKINIDTINDNNKYFVLNKKYCTISLYAFLVIISSSLFIYIINNFSEVKSIFLDFFSSIKSFVIAFFIAYFLHPVVKLVDKRLLVDLCKLKSKKVRNALSILISYIVFLGIIVLLSTYVLPQIFKSLRDFINQSTKTIPNTSSKLYDVINDLKEQFPNLDFSIIEKQIKNIMPEVLKFITNNLSTALSNVITFSISILSTTVSIIMAIVISCYMIADRHIMSYNATRLLYAIFPKEKAKNICLTAKECNSIFYKFVIGKALDSLIIGIITILSMTLLKLDYPILIGVIVGITNMIPYFGPFIGAIPGSLILLIVDPVKGLIFMILILAIQQFDGLYLGPKILGESVGLSPFWIIFAITIGGAYFGVFGMFLGVPILAVITYLLNKSIICKLKKKNVTEKDFNEVGISKE